MFVLLEYPLNLLPGYFFFYWKTSWIWYLDNVCSNGIPPEFVTWIELVTLEYPMNLLPGYVCSTGIPPEFDTWRACSTEIPPEFVTWIMFVLLEYLMNLLRGELVLLEYPRNVLPGKHLFYWNTPWICYLDSACSTGIPPEVLLKQRPDSGPRTASWPASIPIYPF